LFGNFGESRVYLSEAQRMSGYIEFERAKVRWFLSVDRHDLPFPLVSGQNTTLRSITVDGEEVEFSEGFTDLHTRIYEQALAGQGFGVDDIRPATELTHIIRTATAMPIDDRVHPWLRK
jgi:UDP-N-acetyl-2-amino-2-deoxyglucuronate dehydrogenase